MKLSKKGIETIFSALLKTIEERDLVFRQISQGVFKKHIEALEFEPDDFIEVQPKPKEPVVELSVEEAKVINKLVYMASCAFILTNEQMDAEEMLEKRIEQAEMSKQSTQCENVSKKDEKIITLTINEAKNIYHDFASMYVIAKGTYPKDWMRKPYTLDILKMQIEESEKKDESR